MKKIKYKEIIKNKRLDELIEDREKEHIEEDETIK